MGKLVTEFVSGPLPVARMPSCAASQHFVAVLWPSRFLMTKAHVCAWETGDILGQLQFVHVTRKPPCLWRKLLTLDRNCRHQLWKQVAKISLKLLYSLVLHLGHPTMSTSVTCCPTGPLDTSQMSLYGAAPS